jgi:hypothetical protein
MTVVGLHTTADYTRAQQEFFDESVIQKWKDYEAFCRGLQGTARIQRISDGKTQESILRFRQNRDSALAIFPHNRDPLLLKCSLGNPNYLATIDLSKSDPNNVILNNYTPLPENLRTLSPFDFVFMETSRHFWLGSKSLRLTVSDPFFKVTKFAKEIQNGREMVQVDYIYNHEHGDSHVRNRGSLWLDPSQCWCIRRSKFSIEATTRGERSADTDADVVCETLDHPSGFPILKSVTEQFKIFQYKSKRKTEGSSKKDYELEVNTNVPDSEFTLSAFGLPEPGGAEPVKKPIPMYIWILIAAGVCGALAFAFRYLARRKHLAGTA